MSSYADRTQIAGTHWDPQQYLRFSDHRLRPALELLDRVAIRNPAVVYDLGCGTGQVTRLIAERWPSATVYGLDNSKEMLDQASFDAAQDRPRQAQDERGEPGPVRWIEADIRSWEPEEPVDLVYSNATLQWLDGHRELFPRLLGFLGPGGCLAVQMPLSWPAPSHRLMRATLANGGLGGAQLGDEALRRTMDRDWVEAAEVYYDLLVGSATGLDIWETEYLQVLEGPDPVLEWVKGTGLRPILNGLGDEDRARFLSEYSRRLREAYPMRADGKTLYPFRRLFVVVTV